MLYYLLRPLCFFFVYFRLTRQECVAESHADDRLSTHTPMCVDAQSVLFNTLHMVVVKGLRAKHHRKRIAVGKKLGKTNRH